MGAAALTALLLVPSAQAQTAQAPVAGWADDPPALTSLVAFARTESDLRVAVDRYLADKAALERRYEVQYSPVRVARLRQFHEGWQRRLNELDFDALNREGKIDWVLLRDRITHDLALLTLHERRWREIAPLLPFADSIRLLQETRLGRQRAEGRATGARLDAIAREVGSLTSTLVADGRAAGGIVRRPDITPTIAWRAAVHVDTLRRVLADWNAFYDGYDPLVSWWSREPFRRADSALTAYAGAIREHLVGVRPGQPPPIVGDPVLAEGLRADLAVEMIPYTAEELIAIGRKELEWVETEFRRVSERMGFGADWKAALEYTKGLAPSPGEKPWAIFDIAAYSEDFIARLGNVTLPPLAREVWRLAMQTPATQLVNPFFTGGEVTRVSYPTDAMRHEDKIMSMRGNTPHFNFATVHHELIPGHHMQAFLTDRFNAHRGPLSVRPSGPFYRLGPFWREGWSLYWELLLWDADFARNDPDRIGMLFWRLHRAARIIFSLEYQLGNWTPEQAIDFLVDRVGHERANAEAEVRRSALDSPLYQAAYMIGGLQLRALYRELVESGSTSARDFHDGILMGGHMPIEMVRVRLTGQDIGRDFRSSWRFYGAPGERH
ncbi:MAG TPA: DUF885 family protein [Gemmatimonadaceae bacterium]